MSTLTRRACAGLNLKGDLKVMIDRRARAPLRTGSMHRLRRFEGHPGGLNYQAVRCIDQNVHADACIWRSSSEHAQSSTGARADMGGMADSPHFCTSRRSPSEAHDSSATSDNLFGVTDTLLLNTVNQKGVRRADNQTSCRSECGSHSAHNPAVGHGENIARWRRRSGSEKRLSGFFADDSCSSNLRAFLALTCPLPHSLGQKR